MSSLTIENPPVQLCTLEDLTDTPRVGFRGTQSAEYLQARGFTLPDVPNQAVHQADGSHVARLSQTEYLILGSLNDQGERIADEEARWELDHSANYLLPRQDSHAWLQLSGACIAEVMAKLCGVDLRTQAFGQGAVAQTSAARINVIVINTGRGTTPCFQILCDRASLEYFKGAVLDAMNEFNG
ncbi:sarcosine oxidase [Pseudomonas cichorii]|uniref:sarcosine oxidase subunit gamma n=1 Tax=Pseudomonas cichorii TaxID=36746 RepID=UPI001C880D2D|nr:sarcosine oxidase [Pseudomonas cichorii]MBX8514102.1 sarcosine oxidase [Pseudomonas cichorii]MBX8562854.1 sarcosine oxidase [Pseudomonas cichorii]